jgi:RNA polymerase-binding protein DksA
VAQEKQKTQNKTIPVAPNKKTTLTASELNKFKSILLEKRKDLIGNVNEMQDEALKKSRLDASGDLSSMPIHMADIGSDTYEQEFSLGLMDSERKLLTAINEALDRIADKSYGICKATGKPISKARLEAMPWARYSVDFARKVEQGLIPQPEDYQRGLQ